MTSGAHIADEAEQGFPNPKFEAARIQGNLSVQDLWVRYLTAGGHCDIFDIDAHLQGVLALDPFEQDTLACALNERLDELAAAAHIPYLETSEPTPESLLAISIRRSRNFESSSGVRFWSGGESCLFGEGVEGSLVAAGRSA